jgi:uncharacterized protein (AIM24 family)
LCQKDAFLCAAQGTEIEIAFTKRLVAFSPSVSYDIQFVGGFKNALFGGEGIFLARKTGPGKVYLQSLPFSRLADRIFAAAKYRQVDQKSGVAGVGGNVLGGLLGGDRNF